MFECGSVFFPSSPFPLPVLAAVPFPQSGEGLQTIWAPSLGLWRSFSCWVILMHFSLFVLSTWNCPTRPVSLLAEWLLVAFAFVQLLHVPSGPWYWIQQVSAVYLWKMLSLHSQNLICAWEIVTGKSGGVTWVAPLIPCTHYCMLAYRQSVKCFNC